MPRTKSWDPRSHRASICYPILPEAVPEVLILVPPGQPRAVDVSHESGCRHPPVGEECTKDEKQQHRRQLHRISYVGVDAGGDDGLWRIEWHWCAAAPFGKLLNRSQAEQADARQQLDSQTQLPIPPGRPD